MCRDVFAKTGASIELSYAKDKSLNILATGKPSQVTMAKREILKKLQTEVCQLAVDIFNNRAIFF